MSNTSMSYDLQMGAILGLKKDLEECCVRLNMRMDLIDNRLRQAVGQGFPPETAQKYSARYYKTEKKKISDFIGIVQKGHNKYLNDIYKELEKAKTTQ